MPKPEYDNLHKFIMSVGVIFIVLPFILIHFLVTGTYDLSISVDDYNKLTTESKMILNKRMDILAFSLKHYKCGAVISIGIGIILVTLALIKWKPLQDELDKNIRLDNKLKQAGLQPKVKEKNDSNQNHDTKMNTDKKSIADTKELKNDFEINKGILAENVSFEYVSSKYNKKYTILANQISDNFVFDLVGVPKREGKKYLVFEVQLDHIITRPAFTDTINLMKAKAVNNFRSRGLDAEFKLIVVGEKPMSKREVCMKSGINENEIIILDYNGVEH